VQVGDIVVLWGVGIRRLIVDSRDEIIPASGDWSRCRDLRLRTVYRVAGNEFSNQWFTENQLAPVIPR